MWAQINHLYDILMAWLTHSRMSAYISTMATFYPYKGTLKVAVSVQINSGGEGSHLINSLTSVQE